MNSQLPEQSGWADRLPRLRLTLWAFNCTALCCFSPEILFGMSGDGLVGVCYSHTHIFKFSWGNPHRNYYRTRAWGKGNLDMLNIFLCKRVTYSKSKVLFTDRWFISLWSWLRATNWKFPGFNHDIFPFPQVSHPNIWCVGEIGTRILSI